MVSKGKNVYSIIMSLFLLKTHTKLSAIDKLVLWTQACAQFILYSNSNKLCPRYYKNYTDMLSVFCMYRPKNTHNALKAVTFSPVVNITLIC